MKLNKIMALLIICTSFATTAEIQTNPVNTVNVNTTIPTHSLNKYEKNMTGKTWITTEAIDQKGKIIPNVDQRVSNYFGIADYFSDNTFKMLTLDGKPKAQGEWSISEDGKTRTLIARDADGKILFNRVVENVKVTPEEYTYRIYPDSNNKNEYFDIVHKPQ